MADPRETRPDVAPPPSTARLLASARLPSIRAIGIQRAPVKDLYHFVLARSWPTFFGLVGLFFVGANLLFATAYYAQPGCIANARQGAFEDAFFFSVQTLATIGYGGMYPVTRYAHVLVVLEALTGILGIAVITGLTFTRFARPSARVLFSSRATVTPRDAVPHLMFRMANWRRNRIVEAHLDVVLLVTERTLEGETLRRQIDLPLVRERSAVFFLTWTAMHRIDQNSPFYGPDALERLRAQHAELYLSLTGFDETIGQAIHARREYRLDDIAWNARFADVLGTADDGTRVIDYRRFHDVVALSEDAQKVANGQSTVEDRRGVRA